MIDPHPVPVPSFDPATRLRAAAIVRHHAALAAGAALVPFWWAASPSIAGIQLKMLSELSSCYGVEFAQDFVKPLVASLGGGGLSLVMSQHPVSLALKRWVIGIPVVGIPLRFGTGPAIIAAYTWVLGHAFIRHYESGGTYLDFHLGRVREAVHDLARRQPAAAA